MILKGSQRSGARQLAVHLLNNRDNDHVSVHELRGFVADDLHGAMTEAHAIAKGTRCRQPVFSLSLNPPKDEAVTIEALVEAADRAEDALGLGNQPRAIVIHEKNGRRHAHVVWSRIDADEMKAINLPHYKNRLRDLSKDIYLEHGWDLPDGHKANGWKNPLNFTLEEWQQAKRLDLDPRELKQMFRESWERSDSMPAFRHALESHGMFLAKGDRRGFVAVNIQGEVFSLSRWTGAKSRELEAKLGNAERLPSVELVKQDVGKRLTKTMRDHVSKDRHTKSEELLPLTLAKQRMVESHRLERDALDRLQQQRLMAETKERANRFRRGLGAVMDILSGRVFKQRKQNEREAFDCYRRDRQQREVLFTAQNQERQSLQLRIDAMTRHHRQQRTSLARRLVDVMRLNNLSRSHSKRHDGPTLER